MVLGKSEMLITHTDLFTPVELKRRVFRKVVKPYAARPHARDESRWIPATAHPRPSIDNLREAAFDIAGAAQVVLDADRLADHGQRHRPAGCSGLAID